MSGAITLNRPYKSDWDSSDSLREIAEWANDHFEGKVVQASVKSLGIYPIWSLVKLTSAVWPPELIDVSLPSVTEKIVSR